MEVAELLTWKTVFKNCCLVVLLKFFLSWAVFCSVLACLRVLYNVFALWLSDTFKSYQTVWAWISSPNTDILSCLFFS